MKYKFNIQMISSAEVEIEANSLEEALILSDSMDIDYQDTGVRTLDYDSLLTNTIELSDTDMEFLESMYSD